MSFLTMYTHLIYQNYTLFGIYDFVTYDKLFLFCIIRVNYLLCIRESIRGTTTHVHMRNKSNIVVSIWYDGFGMNKLNNYENTKLITNTQVRLVSLSV